MHECPRLPDRLRPAWQVFVVLGGLSEGIRPGDVETHLEMVGVRAPGLRRSIYLGVLALDRFRREWVAERAAAKEANRRPIAPR